MTSLEALVHEWVDYLRVEKGASAHTVSNYRRDALRYVRDLADRGVASLAEVSVRDIEDYTMACTSTRSRKGLSGSTPAPSCAPPVRDAICPRP